MGVDLTVIVPAYNEERRLEPSLERFGAFMAEQAFEYELLVVNDGSQDNTVGVLEKCAEGHDNWRLLENPGNRGKGYSIRHGVAESRGDLVLFTDADFSTPMEELYKLLPYVVSEPPQGSVEAPAVPEAERGAYQVAIASRGLPGSELDRHQPWWRELGGRMSGLAIRTVLPGLWGIRDTQCGFKLFRGDVAREIFALGRIDRYGFDFEVLHIARLRGYRIKEVGVVWRHVEGAKVSVLRDYPRTLLELSRVRWYSWTGRYGAR